jgi:hypothetical protein
MIQSSYKDKPWFILQGNQPVIRNIKNMIYKISLILITLSIGLISCRQVSTSRSSMISLDTIIYNNYCKAIDNEGTFQFFLVAKIKNLNNGQIREICTKGNFLKGALHREYNLGYDSIGTSKVYQMAVDNHKRYFELKNDSAIWNISGVWPYTMDDLSKLEKQVNFDSLVIQIKKNKKWSLEIFEDKSMLMYAHALFCRGILTGENSCRGGTLYYVDDEWLNERKKQREEMEKLLPTAKRTNN